MKKILIFYKSKYGATKKYVDMLKEELDCDVRKTDDFKKAELKNYDCIIFAGGIYAGGIAGLQVLRKHYGQLRDKKILIFCVGASPFDNKSFEEAKAKNLKDDLKEVPMFYGRGAWDESKMSLKDRTLCKMLQKAIAKQSPDSCEPWMKALLSATGQKCDWVEKKYLMPLLDYIKY